MAIRNNICLNCEKAGVCKIADKLAVFDEEAKKNLGVDITLESCKEFKEVVSEETEE